MASALHSFAALIIFAAAAHAAPNVETNEMPGAESGAVPRAVPEAVPAALPRAIPRAGHKGLTRLIMSPLVECSGDHGISYCNDRVLPKVPPSVSPYTQLLSFGGNAVPHVREETFRGVPALQALLMDDCGVRRVHPNAFASLYHLRVLSFKDNALMEGMSQVKLPQLMHTLILDGNCFTDLADKPVVVSHSLRVLTMNRCCLEELTSGILSEVPNLLVFTANDNRIHQLSAAALRPVPHLAALALARNNLTSLDPDLLADNKKMAILNVAKNAITVEDAVLLNAPDLYWLLLAGNDLSKMGSNTLSKLDNVEFVSFSNCSLESLDASWFKGLDNMKRIDLNWNKIGSVDPGVFESLGKLIEVNLAGNPLGAAPPALRSASLLTLNVSRCELGALPDVSGTPALVRLDARGNPLEGRLEPLSGAAALRSLHVAGDTRPALCSCAFRDWLDAQDIACDDACRACE